ncbi:GSCFA family protein [Flavobacterium fluvii]|uniref:GSCFA family protein n=1 Tax=Flavobacterium fluvii TaxID=468056 RepID=A0A1M5IC60_9FLAO|nr:GSCFA domain-containing protein [Flavobacterium fluvii]SHG25827.1 GSCFA family protein [Flavobacterium fluvii]
MQFRTKISILDSNNPIDYNSKIVSLGSCFAVNMAEKLDYFKFQNTCNPFGILFHPLAIEKLMDFAVSGKQFSDDDVFFYEERWHSFDLHSDWSNSNKEELIANLNTVVQSTRQQISEATHIIITYGTSWVYRNLASNAIVANCHKVPQKQFDKEILSVETIENSIENTIALIQKVNPKANVVFTVSPVRHLKDGFVENQLSKSHLITAIHQTINDKPQTINYFPSYEIMMDELRDYRFYAEDMIHPNQVAIDYIWERFSETSISEESHSIMKEVETIQKGLQHRPFNPNSESHIKFEEKLAKKINKIVSQYSFMKF